MPFPNDATSRVEDYCREFKIWMIFTPDGYLLMTDDIVPADIRAAVEKEATDE